jgi:hypothetical protein
VITSNFSFGVPAQVTKDTGIRFSLKSPAVGSTNKHCPFGACIETDVKARVAVSSLSCDSATAEGTKVPPARDTGTASVGFGIPPTATLVITGAEVAEVVEVAKVAGVAELIEVAKVVEVADVTMLAAVVAVGTIQPLPTATEVEVDGAALPSSAASPALKVKV